MRRTIHRLGGGGWMNTVDTEIRVIIIPKAYLFAFAFVLVLIGTDYFSHSGPRRYLTPNFTFAFASVIQKVINSEITLFRILVISVSMVILNAQLKDLFMVVCESLGPQQKR